MNDQSLLNDDYVPSQTDKLIYEIKLLRKINDTLQHKVSHLESQLQTISSKNGETESRLEEEKNKVNFLEKRNKCYVKKYKTKLSILEKEVRRKDIFNKKISGSLKTKKEAYMIQEMDSLRAVNNTLLGFVDLISEKYGFDDNILKNLARVASGVDDNIIKIFIEGLSAKKSREAKYI